MILPIVADRTYPNAFSEDGAKRIARRIREYWAARGGIVETRLEPIRTKYTDEATARDGSLRGYVVRSDMFNGLPSKWAAERQPILLAA